MVQRRFRVVAFNKGSVRYLSLRVEWRDGHGAWRGKTVRSYGVGTAESQVQADADRLELQRLAPDPSAPIPIGMLTDAVWAGLRQALGDPVAAFPFLPLLAARDLAHLGANVISQAIGDIPQQVSVTQPHMDDRERPRFIRWLSEFSEDDRASILSFQWKFDPLA